MAYIKILHTLLFTLNHNIVLLKLRKKGELPLPKIIDDVFKILFIEMIRFYRGI